MSLWLLVRTDGVGYDEYDSLVVRAESEQAAREAADRSDCWGPWLRPEACNASEISADGDAEVIHASFCAG
jgi:hypothetical protein